MSLLGDAKGMIEGGLNTGTSVRDKGYQLVNFLKSDEAAKYTKGNNVLDKLREGLANLLSKLLEIADMILDIIVFILELIGALEELIKEGLQALLTFIFDLISNALLTGPLGIRQAMLALYNKLCKDTLKNTNYTDINIVSITIFAVTGTLISLICNGNIKAMDALQEMYGDDVNTIDMNRALSQGLKHGKANDPALILQEMSNHPLTQQATMNKGLNSKSVLTFLNQKEMNTLSPSKKGENIRTSFNKLTGKELTSPDIPVKELNKNKNIKNLLVKELKSKSSNIPDPDTKTNKPEYSYLLLAKNI